MQAASQRCPTTIARGGGGVGREPLQPAGPPIRWLASVPTCSRDVGRRGGERVVVVRLEPHHPGGLRGPKADREDRAERDRHLAEDVARRAIADHPLDPVD